MQSLLFCQDEKSARVLMRLVQGLDVVITHETELFSAMRTVTAERFDFLIIDYEDERTGRILLKNARSSARNKAALAVAVVDLETGANALRLGADFLVTRPINLGQAEGVLRLVRSSALRRKVSSAESAPGSVAAEPVQLSEEATSAPQELHTAMANAPVTTNSNLTESTVNPSGETSVGCSDGRATLCAGLPVELENERAMSALDGTAAESKQTVDGQDRHLTEIEEVLFDGDTRIALESPPTSAAGSETANLIHTALSNRVIAEQPDIRSRNVLKYARVEKRPSQLFLASMAVLGIILLTVAAIAWHIHTENSSANGDTAAQSSPASSPGRLEANTPESTPAPAQFVPQSEIAKLTTRAPAAPSMAPGKLSINSTPQGTKVRQTKAATGNQLFVRTDLDPLAATVALNSEPANAAVWMDGKDTGRRTPAQISVDKPGTHNFIFKKQGYLDESTTANLRIGQTVDFGPSLRPLGRTDEIKTVGTFGRIFGGGETAGQGIVSVKTKPKGAQIAVNSRTIDRPSPANFYLNPGNYLIDISSAGFKVIHREVSVEKGGKITIDEVMDRE